MTTPSTPKTLPDLQADYAQMLIHTGVKIQAEEVGLYRRRYWPTRPLKRKLAAAAYQAAAS